QSELHRVVAVALEEDLGSGDITTDNLVPAETQARAAVEFRSGGVVCGINVLEEVFRQLDPDIVVERYYSEGAQVEPRTTVAMVHGTAPAILQGERVALNYVQRMAATA